MRTWSGDIKDKNHVRKIHGTTTDDFYLTREGDILRERKNKVYVLSSLQVGKYTYLPGNILFKEKPKSKRIDYMVATLFPDILPNPKHYSQIKHKDNDMTNNSLDNLEWANIHIARNYRCVKVRCVETGQVFDSQSEAAKFFKVSEGYISGLLSGNYGSTTVKKKHLEIVDDKQVEPQVATA